MRIFLAGISSRKNISQKNKIKYILESYYYINNDETLKIIRAHNKNNFLLDSGAFTFMNCFKGEVDFNKYLEKYINFINENDIKYFFELDIDSVVGYIEVLKMRKKLEKETGKKCIPVWHKSRGLKDFIETTKNYDYVAIGGIVTKEIPRGQWKFMCELIDIAHKNNCKIHGLGFTTTKELKNYKFDSVDSTSWINGTRFGVLHIFKNNYIEALSFKNKRVKYRKRIDEHNINEWIKFVDFADNNL